jgi:hypothetical protein
MKALRKRWLLLGFTVLSVIHVASSQSVPGKEASPARVEISAMPRKETKERDREGVTSTAEKSFQYSVKITNRSFRDVSGLRVEYRIFVRNDSGKGAVTQQKMSKQAFKLDLPAILKHGEFSFDTEPVSLKSSKLDGGWIYKDGSRSKVEDRVAGIWLKVFQDGNVVGEYMNPTSLKSKESFD